MTTIKIKITDYEIYEPEEKKNHLEIIDGNFCEGEKVTVSINGKVFTRRVRYSARKWADLYITINGYTVTYSEFYEEDFAKYADYSFIG